MSEEPDGWWYDAARCQFVRGLYPVITEALSESLVRDLVADKPVNDLPEWAARLRELARHLLFEVRPEAPA